MQEKFLYNQLTNILKELLPRVQREEFERKRQTDNVVVWLAGLSTGAIVLIFSQSNKAPFIDFLTLKITVVFLLFTIIAGVIFRAFFYFLEQVEAELMLGFEGYCYATLCKPYGPIEITEVHTIEDIVKSLKEDMGFDYADWIDKECLTRDFWVEHYNKCADFWKKTEKEGFRQLGRQFAPIVGKKPEEMENLFLKTEGNSKSPQKAIKLRKVCHWAYSLMMIFFVLAIITVTIGYLIK
ncbi:hypothetical protein KAR91_45595 [Candidatus Pacearchaeota archaeon]|nr:hypothetical protein [Candidatus Pacearchaeota archaeon]